MKVAILGWGSLIKEPNGLQIVGGWRKGGPRLPIELSRRSQRRGHLTFVIDERHHRCLPTQYTFSRLMNLPNAIADLAWREGCPRRRIGYVQATEGRRRRSRTAQGKQIRKWARAQKLDAAIWTDLPPKPGRFTVEAALRAWRQLPPETQEAARRYVRLAPKETDTDLRRRLRKEKLI